MSTHYQNRRAWDQMVHRGERFARPAREEDFQEALKQLAAAGCLEQLRGKQMLCLAAGGGRQGPLYAAAGAHVTVVDISGAQLELDRRVAGERKLVLRTVETSMDDLSMFAVGEFQIVVHPVSTCYLPKIHQAYREIARVTEADGLYLSQHKQPASLQARTPPTASGYHLAQPYYCQGPLPPVTGSLHREEGTLEYLHRWEDLLGGMCRAGFVIEDVAEPRHAQANSTPGTFAHRSYYAAPYVRVKARRKQHSVMTNSVTPTIWIGS